MAEATHLVIIPDGELLLLPFQALIGNDGKHLIEKCSLSYAPSVTALMEMIELGDARRRSRASAAMLAVGVRKLATPRRYRDEELILAEPQARRIARLFGGEALIGAQVTERRVKAMLTGRRFLHLASHGEADSEVPFYSAVFLQQGARDDGALYARELMDLYLKAELVVLAACETARGREVKGEGVLGLSWAVFVAGAPSSLVSQWKVLDQSADLLMAEFYRQLKGNSANKAAALRQAQIRLIRSQDYGHPYHWALFVLTGDWR